ncbi:hypothetical protein TNCV_3387991 [Trichonephila clavipes]|nr:hypothetical protein TNCV_3387991 [Trichonephila clavipes]
MVVPYLRGLRNAFQQNKVKPHVTRHVLTLPDTQGIRLLLRPARSPDLSPLKTSGHELLRDWIATPLQLVRLMKWGINLKHHGMSRSFLSFKPCSTPCPTE